MLKLNGKLIFSFNHYLGSNQNRNSFENLETYMVSERNIVKYKNEMIGVLKNLNNPTSIVPAKSKADTHFYNSQSYYLMSPTTPTQIIEQLNRVGFMGRVESLTHN